MQISVNNKGHFLPNVYTLLISKNSIGVAKSELNHVNFWNKRRRKNSK